MEVGSPGPCSARTPLRESDQVEDSSYQLLDTISGSCQYARNLICPARDRTHMSLTRQQMDELVDGHFRAEESGDVAAIVDGFTLDAEHDVPGRPGGPLHGGSQIAAFYRSLLADLRIERFETLHRWYGEDHAVDESILHATAVGSPFGLPGRRRAVKVRLLHVFDFAGGRISRESAWLDMGAVQQQLA